MKFLTYALLFLSAKATSYAQVAGPHIVFQARSGKMERAYLTQFLYSYLDQGERSLMNADLALNKKIVAPLNLKMKDNLINSIEGSFLLRLGNSGHANDLTKTDIENIKNGNFDLIEFKKLEHRAAFEINVNELSYLISPQSLSMTNFTIKKIDNERSLLKVKLDVSDIEIEAKNICLTFITFTKGTDEKPIKNQRNSCDGDPENTYTTDDFIMAYFYHPEEIVKNEQTMTGPIFLSNITARVKDTFVHLLSDKSLSFNASFVIHDKGDGTITLQGNPEESGYEKSENFLKNFSLEFARDDSVKLEGLSGFVFQDSALYFNSKVIMDALYERKKELLSLIVKPFETILQSQVDKLKASEKFGQQRPLAMTFNSISAKAEQVSFWSERPQDVNKQEAQIEYFGFGINFDFSQSSSQKSVSDQSTMRKDYESIQEKLREKHLQPSNYHADLIFSFSEKFFNDAVTYGLELVEDKIAKSPFSFSNIDFKIDGTGQFFKEEDALGKELEMDVPLGPIITGCISYNPPLEKKLLNLLVNTITDESNVIHIPLMAYTYFGFDQNSESQIPAFRFNIYGVESDQAFLNSKEDCEISKVLKKPIAKIAKKQIDKALNKEGISELDIVKIAFPALEGIPANAIRILTDRELKRINLLINLGENISSDELEKMIRNFSDPEKKIQATFPKLEIMKKGKQ